MWNRVVGQIGQAWNQPQTEEQREETDANGVSSDTPSVENGDYSGLSPQQYKDVLISKENEISSVRDKYETLFSKFKSLQSSYETDLQAERSVIEALKHQIMEIDEQHRDANTKADDKFSRLKQQARNRINELSKEIDALKLGQGADTRSTLNPEKMEDSLNISPFSSRAGSPDRLQQELFEKEKELESVQNDSVTLRHHNIELDTQLSQLQLEITQLQPIKNELKSSLASIDRVEQENTQLTNDLQDIKLKNSLLESRINEVIDERKQSEENLDQFKKYKLNEFQEVIHNKSDEIEALNNSLSLLRLEYTDERNSRVKQDSQLSSLREEKELSTQRYQQLVIQVEGYTKEIEKLKSAGEEKDTVKEVTGDPDYVKELLQEVSDLKSDLRDCREEIELKREEILSKECELNDQEDKILEALKESDRLTEEVNKCTNLLGECNMKAEQTDTLNTELSETVNALRKEVEENELAVNASQLELSNSGQQLEHEQLLVSELRTQLGEARGRETELKGLNCDLENSLSKSEKDPHTDIKEMSSQLLEENQALVLHVESVTSEITDLRLSNSSLLKLQQNLDEGMSVLHAQTETQAKQIEDLETEKSDLRNDMSTMGDQSADLDSIVSSQREELAFNSTKIDSLDALVVSLREDNSIIRDHDSSVQSELEQIVSQLNEATNDYKTLTEELEKTNKEVLSSQQSNTTHQERIFTLEAELQEKQRLEVETLRESSASNEEVEKQLTSAREECFQYKSKLSELQLSVDSWNTEKENLRSALEQANKLNNTIKLDLQAASIDNNKITTEFGKVNLEKDRLTTNMTSLQERISQLSNEVKRKDSELDALLRTTETASSEMSLLQGVITGRDNELRTLREQNTMMREDAKRMQEGFDSALELIQNKLDRAEKRVTELEVSNSEREAETQLIREERARTATENTQLQEQIVVCRGNQQNQSYTQSENEKLRNLNSEQSAQLIATQNDVERLQQENVVLGSSQESTLSGVQDQEVRSLRLSQDMANMSRENEESARKLASVNRQLEVLEFEKDHLSEENTTLKESKTQLQTLQLQFEQVTSEMNTLRVDLSVERNNWQKEREEIVSQHQQQQQQQQQQTAELASPVTEVPAATTFYLAQLEERLQNVGYTHGQELQRLRDTLEMEKLKSSQLEVALNKSSPSDGLPLPVTNNSEDFSFLNQSTLGDCATVLKNQLIRWKANPKIAMTRFFKSRPLPQLVLMAYFVCLHLLFLFSIF